MPDPTSPVDDVSQALSRVAADTRRTTAYYGNLRGAPGASLRPRRLVSEFGFPEGFSFSYVAPATAHVTPHDAPRNVTSFTLHPYGLLDDVARLTSSTAADRRSHTAGNGRTSGVAAYPADARLLMSAELESDTYAPRKTTRAIEALVTAARGPAYHFLVTRRGDLFVGALLDHATTASHDNAETTIDIALEGAFVVRREDHARQRFDARLVELPYTPDQLLTLTTLIAKLRTAYSAVPATLDGGILYDYDPARYLNAPKYNFSNGAWRGASLFDHGLADAPAFLTNLALVPPFDLATQVFLTDRTPPPVATRAVAQTAISQADTVGQQSVLLANYATLAGPERSAAMQQTPRAQFFVQRANMAVRDADGAGNSSANVAEAGRRASPGPATGVEPHTYDFTTGRWSDDHEPF
jgi:hypothetical protein